MVGWRLSHSGSLTSVGGLSGLKPTWQEAQEVPKIVLPLDSNWRIPIKADIRFTLLRVRRAVGIVDRAPGLEALVSRGGDHVLETDSDDHFPGANLDTLGRKDVKKLLPAIGILEPDLSAVLDLRLAS
jgi:hypothetical protein